VLQHGPPKIIANDEWPGERPFVVLSPQNEANCPSSSSIHNFITYAASTYDVDPKRIYLSGLSCGAIGSWQYLGDHLDSQVAAAVLVAGDPGDPAQPWSSWGKSGCELGKVALWAFHGDQDDVVTIGNEQATMNNLLACPAPPRREVKWDVIAGGGHFIWPAIYDGSTGFDIYGFLLQNPKPLRRAVGLLGGSGRHATSRPDHARSGRTRARRRSAARPTTASLGPALAGGAN
jgi:dienelactone hydrolase